MVKSHCIYKSRVATCGDGLWRRLVGRGGHEGNGCTVVHPNFRLIRIIRFLFESLLFGHMSAFLCLKNAKIAVDVGKLC